MEMKPNSRWPWDSASESLATGHKRWQTHLELWPLSKRCQIVLILIALGFSGGDDIVQTSVGRQGAHGFLGILAFAHRGWGGKVERLAG